MLTTAGSSSRSRSRSRLWIRLAAAAAVVAVAGAGCADNGRTPLLSGLGETSASLHTDLSCGELVELTREQLGVTMASGNRQFEAVDDMMVLESDAAEGSAESAPKAAADRATGGAAAMGEAGEVVAGTNIQEQGVDEADLVKTDGRRIVTLVEGTLRVTTLDGTPAVDGQLVLDEFGSGGGQMFLRGDEALVFLPVWGNDGPVGIPEVDFDDGAPPETPGQESAAETMPVPFDQGVRILRVDLAQDSQPAVVEDRIVEGSLVAARMVDGTARVVVRSPMPVMAELWEAEDLAGAESVVADLDVSDVLPRVSDTDGSVTSLGECDTTGVVPLVDGDALEARALTTSLAQQPATVSVLTVGETLEDLAPATVSGLADIVYASVDSMFVTSTGWSDQGPSTFVHRFAMPGDDPALYTGSGMVPGVPLNQYSLSESGGDLRIVTTTDGPFDSPEALDMPVEEFDEPGIIAPEEFVPATEGRVTILRPVESGTLAEIGVVEDLGIGERVQSVRFIGEMAYVVTFRQTDPLYAIDLSDPTDPRALGELKITGFSEYLHPVGNNLLLGIGREATEDGMDIGFKASLFDVSDPTAPTEIDKVVIPDAHSIVGSDPLAFTWDPMARHAIFPLEQYPEEVFDCPPNVECAMPDAWGPTTSALVLGVDGDQLGVVDKIIHPAPQADQWRTQILRSVVVDRDLWTVSAAGLGLSDADSPTTVQLTAY